MIAKNLQIPLAVVAGIVVIGFLARKQLADTAQALASVNEGTAFEGTGVIGTLGNATNAASGGLFARFGNFIARTLDPNENKTLDELTGT